MGTQTQLSVYGQLNRNKAIFSVSISNGHQVSGGYAGNVIITNVGNLAAANTVLTSARLGAASAPTSPVLPISLGTLLPGQSATVPMTFPATAGPPRSAVTAALLVSWYTTATNSGFFTPTATVTLP